jgi:tyrosyl-tRNA synthetase
MLACLRAFRVHVPDKKAAAAAAAAPVQPEREWTANLQADHDRLLSVAEECITAADLRSLILRRGHGSGNGPFILYDGFEPSGRMHIAQGIVKAINVNK